MGILDRFKKTREDDEDEDARDGDDESSDEDSGSGGLLGRIGALRSIGGNAAGVLGKVLKRGSDSDDDDDDEPGLDVAAPSPALITGFPEESVAVSSDEEAIDGETADQEDAIPLAVEALVTGTPAEDPEASGDVDIFAMKMEADLGLRDLAMSQDAITAQQLADDLEVLLGRLTRMSRSE